MATLSGRITITAADETEFNSLVSAAISGPDYNLVSTDESTFTLVVDLVEA